MKFLKYLLLPFSVIYFLITEFRNFLFDYGVFKSYHSSIPVVVIGNLSTGGTGKTPHTIFLINSLINHKKIAVLSRGYGRESKVLKQVLANGNPIEFGDEPVEIKNRFPSINMIVSNSRKDGLKFIEDNFPQTELVILDDGFQHRWIKPTYSILLTKYSNPFCSDFLLPFGNLRESAKNSKRANSIIISKTTSNSVNTSDEYWRKKLKLNNNQSLFFSELIYNHELLSIISGNTMSIQELRNSTIVLITSIASNLELINFLENNCKKIIKLEFPDHHTYKESDIFKIKLHSQKLKEKNLIGITTAKDSVKLKNLESLKSLEFDIFVIQSNVSIIGKNKEIELLNQINKIC